MPTQNDLRSIRNWLFFTAFMVFAMAIIGAITRLTESGLSMVEWKPLIGALPPMSHEEWERVFGLYRQTPEFLHKNSWMELNDFKTIFFWEWLHRLWGRVIGLVYALPLLWFWVRKKIPQGYKAKFVAVLMLGGLQGFMGWFMVMSGLVDVPAVSHFRLAAHLSLALALFCVLLWLAFDFMPERQSGKGTFCQKRHGWMTFALVAVTIVWGAFVAGKDGGMLYNTWPKMDSHWIPPEVTGIYAVLHDPAAIQFFHRWIAVATFLAVCSFAWRMKNAALGGMIFVQIGLGIATVMSQVVIPVAALHQAGAIILLGLITKQMHVLYGRRIENQSLVPEPAN